MNPTPGMLKYKKELIKTFREKGYNMLEKIDMLSTIIRCITAVIDSKKALLPPELVSCLDAILVEEERRHIGYRASIRGEPVCRYNNCFAILSKSDLAGSDIYCEHCNDARRVQCLYVDPATGERCTNKDLFLICYSHPFYDRDPLWHAQKCKEAEALIETGELAKADALADAEIFARELAVAVEYDAISALVEKLVEKLEIICK